MGLNDAGVPGRNLPAGEDHVMRRLADLERVYRELVASTAVRPGSLGNDALTSVVQVQPIDQVIPINFTLTTTHAVICTLPLVVPAGITSIYVSLTIQAKALNTTTNYDTFCAAIFLDTAQMASAEVVVAPGVDNGGLNFPANSSLSGVVPNSTINLKLWAWSLVANWPAYLNNGGTMKGYVLWTR